MTAPKQPMDAQTLVTAATLANTISTDFSSTSIGSTTMSAPAKSIEIRAGIVKQLRPALELDIPSGIRILLFGE